MIIFLKDAPEVRISLGRTINGAEIKEGDDLYIECHIRSNPPTHKLQWTHNVMSLCWLLFKHHVSSPTSLLIPSLSVGKWLVNAFIVTILDGGGRLQGNVLMHNVSGGVVLSNVSLVLRAVTYARAGLYACSATNSRGETTVSKPPLRLRIQCKCFSLSLSHLLLLLVYCNFVSYQLLQYFDGFLGA